MTTPKSYNVPELRAMVAELRAAWPLAFGEPVRPLALGVSGMIVKARPAGRTKRDIKAAMRFHVSSDAYLEATRDGARRVHLDGSDAGEVEAVHRDYARQRLEERLAIRRKAGEPSS
jgi:sRNA-binding protein